MLEHIDVNEVVLTRQLPPDFNWIAILKDLAAGAEAEYTTTDHNTLKLLAGSWPTCACGQVCINLPRRSAPLGAPSDSILYQLGTSFYHKVELRQWHNALEVFRKIEARTAELLNESN